MADRGSNSGGAASQAIAKEELARLWAAWRIGSVPCPRDAGRVALAVDASSQTYRLVCVRCGAASSWFETPPSGLKTRTGTSSIPAAGSGLGDD